MVCRFRQVLFSRQTFEQPYNTTFPCEGIRFELCRFHSPLLTVSRLISFPAPTEMFQFGAFPIITDHYGEVPFGDPGFIGSLHLPRAYRSLARPSSALEPSHPPDSIIPVYPNQVQFAWTGLGKERIVSERGLNTSLPWCLHPVSIKPVFYRNP